MNRFVDTHIHFDAPEFACSGVGLLAELEAAGIVRLVIPGIKPDSWDQLLSLARKHNRLFAALGLHPYFAELWSFEVADRLAGLARDPEVVAIGEIGLDSGVGPALDRQLQVFREQLEIACAAKLPILLHSRKTTPQMLDILEEYTRRGLPGGIWHGFSGSVETARRLVDLGFKLGIGTVLLKPTVRKLLDVVKLFPLESFVLETDYPYQTERPQELIAVARRLAEIRCIALDEVARVTSRSAAQLFHWEWDDQ